MGDKSNAKNCKINNKEGSIKICFKAGISVLLVLTVLFMGCKNEKSNEVAKEKMALKLHNEIVRGSYKPVSTSALKKWIDEKKDIIIVDTMPKKSSYDKNHIPGAKQFLFPIPEMKKIDSKMKSDFIKLLGANKNKIIVMYCGFVKCTRSHNGAMWAVKLGYKNVYRHPGGIFAWKDAGYDIEKTK